MKRLMHWLENAFVPHEGNGHRPRILRPRAVAVICLVLALAEAAFLFGISHVAPRSRLFGVIVVNALTDGTNAARTQDGLPALEVSPLLQAAAQQKANDMVANDYFAHTSPDGLSPWYWFENVGYSFIYAGENLAVDFSDSQDVTNAWLNSPEHRANILNANFTQIGIAVATGTFQGHEAVYVVEDFGMPAPQLAPIAQAASIPPSSPPSASVAASAQEAAVAKEGPTSSVAIASPVVAQAKPAPRPQPVIVAATSSETSSSEETFVAVKGASTENIPAPSAVVGSSENGTDTSTVPAVTQTVQDISPAVPTMDQSNAIQRIAANPAAALNEFYFLIAILFGFALLLNVFVKIRVQHPNLIMGGIVAISLAGIFILLNQQLIAGIVIK